MAGSPAKEFASMEREDFLGFVGKAIGEDDMSWWPEVEDLSQRAISSKRARTACGRCTRSFSTSGNGELWN